MGIDYCAGYADVIPWKAIVELVPQAAVEFMAVIEKHRNGEDADYLLAGLANAINYEDRAELADRLSGDDREEAAIEILRSYEELRTAFAGGTAVPEADSKLELGIGYHNSETAGCRGDEVDGVYWCIDDGAWILSPAGRRFKDKFERKYFTSWG